MFVVLLSQICFLIQKCAESPHFENPLLVTNGIRYIKNNFAERVIIRINGDPSRQPEKVLETPNRFWNTTIAVMFNVFARFCVFASRSIAQKPKIPIRSFVYRRTHCGFFRAFLCPIFLRSTLRASRVKYPKYLSGARYTSGL